MAVTNDDEAIGTYQKSFQIELPSWRIAGEAAAEGEQCLVHLGPPLVAD
jgi:hypothetical protein